MERLKKPADFERLKTRGAKAITTTHLIFKLGTDKETARVGFIVSKKNGGAVQRNRIKRRLRAASREILGNSSPPADYVIIGRPAALRSTFQAILADMKKGLNYLKKTEKQIQPE